MNVLILCMFTDNEVGRLNSSALPTPRTVTYSAIALCLTLHIIVRFRWTKFYLTWWTKTIPVEMTSHTKNGLDISPEVDRTLGKILLGRSKRA